MYPYNGKTKSRQLQISIPSVLNHSFASVLVRSRTFTQLQLWKVDKTGNFRQPSPAQQAKNSENSKAR